MAEALGEALLYLRTDDRGLDAGLTKAKGKSDQLGVSFDNASGKADDLGKSMDRAGQSASKFGDVQTKVTTQTGAQRAGINQLMMQVNDMGTMYSLGARPMQIFSSQIGQITQAIQLASGGTSRFATIIGSPWTMAISTAAVVLIPLVANLLETEDAADKAGKANQTWADKLDASKRSVDEVIMSLRDYRKEQEKTRETTLEAAQAAAASASAKIKEALATRQQLAAELAVRKATAEGSAGQGTGGAAGSYLGGRADVSRAAIAENEAKIATLTSLAQSAVADVADELAKLDTDPTERARLGFRELRKEARGTIKDVEQLRKRFAEINRAETAAIAAINKAKRSDKSASAAAPGDATRFISPVSGGRITGNFGENRGNRDHAGIDIAVPVGTPVKAPAGGVVIEAGNVPGYGNVIYIDHGRGTISRLAHLSKIGVSRGDVVDQGKVVGTSGGARGAPGSGNSRGPHVHQEVRVNGRPVNPLTSKLQTDPASAQEKADRLRQQDERAAEQETRRVERYSRDLAGLQDAALGLQAQLGQTAEERFQLEKQGLEISIAEQKRRIEVNTDYTGAERETLLAALERKAGLERELLDRRRQEELARQAVEISQAMWDNERELLDKQSALSDVREERKAIEQKILDEAYKQHRLALEATIASSTATETAKAAASDKLSKLDQNKALDQQRLNRDFESPLDRYRREIVGVGNNLNDEMERVSVSGIEQLSNGLADVVTGAQSLGSVFKAVAQQIIADLIRIAIQQLVVKSLMSAIGGGGGGDGATSLISGGSSIGSGFAGFFAKGGLIPDGSFGIVGEKGPEPVFATSGGVGVLPNSAMRSATMGGGPSISIPISIDATGADAAAIGRVQSQLDRLQQELPTTIVNTVQDAGDRRIISSRKW